MTLNDLEDAVLDHFNADTESADSKIRRRIRRHLNQWHRRILSTPGIQGLRDGTLSFASVASTASYTFPNAIARVRRVWETSNDLVLTGRGLDWYRRVEPDPQSGTPHIFVPAGYQATASQPSATGLWAVSSSASDTTGTILVEYVRTGGIVGSASATLTGTTRVAIGSDTDIVEVTKCYLTKSQVGTVTLYNASTAGTALAAIPIGKLSSRYYHLILWPTPSAALTYYVDYEREVEDLTNAADEPLLPQDFHYLLEVGARISEYEKQDDSRRAVAEAVYAEGMRRLLGRVNFPAGAVMVPGEIAGAPLSRLGPWYPKGS